MSIVPFTEIPPGAIPTCYEGTGEAWSGPPFPPCRPWERDPDNGTLNWSPYNCDTIVAGCTVRTDVENTAHSADFSQAWFRSGTLHDGVTEMVSMHPTRVNMPAEGRFQEPGSQNQEVCVYALSWPWLDEDGNQVALMGNQVDSAQFHNIVGHPFIMTEDMKESLERAGRLPLDTFKVGCQYWVFGRMTARKVETWYFSQIQYCGFPRQ